MGLKSISDGKAVSLDHVCVLLSGGNTADEVGNQVMDAAVRRTVFCAELPASRSEFYSAGQQGLRPECVLLADSEEYGGEALAEYAGAVYAVYRVYPRADGLTELYLGERGGVPGGDDFD